MPSNVFVLQASNAAIKNSSIITEKTGLLSAYSVLVIPAQEKLVIKCVASILVRNSFSFPFTSQFKVSRLTINSPEKNINCLNCLLTCSWKLYWRIFNKVLQLIQISIPFTSTFRGCWIKIVPNAANAMVIESQFSCSKFKWVSWKVYHLLQKSVAALKASI